jgi:hypothetical protein
MPANRNHVRTVPPLPRVRKERHMAKATSSMAPCAYPDTGTPPAAASIAGYTQAAPEAPRMQPRNRAPVRAVRATVQHALLPLHHPQPPTAEKPLLTPRSATSTDKEMA